MLAHQRRGEGRHAVILVHGFLGSGRNLGALARAWAPLDPEIRFVQVDLPGHGRSPPLAPGADLDTMAEAVLDLADGLSLEGPLWIVGHSIGGRVALSMRALAPERIARASILDIAPGPTRGLPTTNVADILLEAPGEAPDRDTFRDFFRDRGLSGGLTDWLLMNLDRDEAGYRWRIDRQALVDFHERTGDTDLWPVAEAHAAALECLKGADSAYLTDADAARYRSIGIDVTTIPDAGHFLHVDQTEAVAKRLTENPHPAVAR